MYTNSKIDTGHKAEEEDIVECYNQDEACQAVY